MWHRWPCDTSGGSQVAVSNAAISGRRSRNIVASWVSIQQSGPEIWLGDAVRPQYRCLDESVVKEESVSRLCTTRAVTRVCLDCQAGRSDPKHQPCRPITTSTRGATVSPICSAATTQQATQHRDECLATWVSMRDPSVLQTCKGHRYHMKYSTPWSIPSSTSLLNRMCEQVNLL